MTAIILSPDGTQRTETLPTGEPDSLRFLQKHVDGLVDVVRVMPDLDMWVNDEGFGVLDRNILAEAIVHHETGRPLSQQFFGTVVFTSVNLDTGESTPLPEHWVKRIGQYRMPVYGFVMLPPTTIPRRS